MWPEFLGKFNSRDAVKSVNLDSVNYNGIDIDGDFARLDKIPEASSGFKLYLNNDKRVATICVKTISNLHYPVYVVNESNSNRYFTLKDDYVLAIQEALYTDGNWYPIEMRGADFCWNGQWAVKVKPKEFVVFLMNKYGGNFKTKLRVRLLIGRLTYFSDPFDGYISCDQFFVQDDRWRDPAIDTNFISNFWFHGAIPLQLSAYRNNYIVSLQSCGGLFEKADYQPPSF